MSTEDNNQAAATEQNTGGGEGGSTSNIVTLSKEEYDKLITEHGSLKREKKEWTKAQTSKTEETPQKTNSDDPDKITRFGLRAVGYAKDEIDLALATMKKWGLQDAEELIDDPDWTQKLERHRTQKSNEAAASNIKGDKSGGQAKDTPEYWLAKGAPPTPDQVPDRQARAKIARAFMAQGKNNGKKFHND